MLDIHRVAVIGIAIIYLILFSGFCPFIPKIIKLPGILRLLYALLIVALLVGTVLLQSSILGRGLDGNFFFIVVMAQETCTLIILFASCYIMRDKLNNLSYGPDKTP